MAKVGDTLVQPEAGWKRYDDRDTKIFYDKWGIGGQVGHYNGTTHNTGPTDSNRNIKFKFYGTKIRIISDYDRELSTSCYCEIDGNKEIFSLVKLEFGKQKIVYEKLNLDKKLHTVTINNGSGRMYFDAVDIDGELFSINYTPQTKGYNFII